MTDDRTAMILFGALALLLPLSALLARRPSMGAVLRALMGWALIAGILYIGFANRDRIVEAASGLGKQLGLEEQTVDGDTVRIRQSPDGHFWATVRLNGYERRMLIDSGATATAISEETARNAGIRIRRAPPVMLTTANGTIRAARGRAETVRVGGLETRDLPVVISPTFESFDVIGMNFLSRLNGWRVERSTLILQGEPTNGTGSDNPNKQ